MKIRLLRSLELLGLLGLLLLAGPAPAAETRSGLGQTPPRLSLIDGSVSFWRTGADEWSEAALNTPLAAGDALYTDEDANLEMQIGNRAFVRAGEETQISVVNIEPDYLQFRVADGQASFDLRALPVGLTIEVNTPNAAFIIERSGYYRLDVDQNTTSFQTRRGGQATVLPNGGKALAVSPAAELIVEGSDTPSVESYAVPERDSWDRWNDERSDHLVDALSSRYVPPDVYGAEALDDHGDWRVEARYGALWVPSGQSSGWAPYSDGRWIWDPYYGWTWIDNAPWGWAPFHYGRWIYLDGYWAWAPGPVVSRTVYAPALVAFFNPGGASVSVSIGLPGVSWVALSWGEPLLPWWGVRGFVGVPWWGGWHGPRVTRNVTQVTNITNVYYNTRVNHAVVGAPREQFGRGRLRTVAVEPAVLRQLAPVRGVHPVRPDAHSVSTGTPSKLRPTREVLSRPAVTVRAPRAVHLPWKTEKSKGTESSGSAAVPQLRFVPRPKRDQVRAAPFGQQSGPERVTPAQAPRFDNPRRGDRPALQENGERGSGRAPGVSPKQEREAPPMRSDERRRVPLTPPATGERRGAQAPSPKESDRRPPVQSRETPPPLPPAKAPARRGEESSPTPRGDVIRAPQRRQEAAPPTVPPPRDNARRDVGRDGGRDTGRDGGSGRRAERDEARKLPGNPANRMAPKRRGTNDEEENSGRGRRN
jgi:hypothetical protein